MVSLPAENVYNILQDISWEWNRMQVGVYTLFTNVFSV